MAFGRFVRHGACMKTRIIPVLGFLLLAACGQPRGAIVDFESCILAGYPIMESYPRRCAVPNGPTFTEELPPVSDRALESFSGALLRVEPDVVGGETRFSFGDAVDATRTAVLEPDATVSVAGTDDPVDLRNVAEGTFLRVRGWIDDGVVHAVEVDVGP